MEPSASQSRSILRAFLSWALPGKLKMEGDTLCGRLPLHREYRQISPEDVLDVREYCGGIGQLRVKTPRWTYRAKASSRDYKRVVGWLEKNTDYCISGSVVNAYNTLFHGPLFGYEDAEEAAEEPSGARGDEDTGKVLFVADLFIAGGSALSAGVLAVPLSLLVGELGLVQVKSTGAVASVLGWPGILALSMLFSIGVTGVIAGWKFRAGRPWARKFLLWLTGLISLPIFGSFIAGVLIAGHELFFGHTARPLQIASLLALALGVGLPAVFAGWLLLILWRRPAKKHTAEVEPPEEEEPPGENNDQGVTMPGWIRLALGLYIFWAMASYGWVCAAVTLTLSGHGEAVMYGALMLPFLLLVFAMHVYAVVKLAWRQRRGPALVARLNLVWDLILFCSYLVTLGEHLTPHGMGTWAAFNVGVAVLLLLILYLPRSSRAWFGRLTEERDVVRT